MIALALQHNSLEVFQYIVSLQPVVTSVRLVAHPVSLNWRQKYGDAISKVSHIDTAFEHAQPWEVRSYTREEFLLLRLADIQDKRGKYVWSVCSKVVCENGEERHVPMMNFHPETVSLDVLTSITKRICLGYEGAMLHSGRYFHYYGNSLLSERQWIEFMADFLMPCVAVSPRYIGQRLFDGYCTLRLTTDGRYKTKIPEVIALI